MVSTVKLELWLLRHRVSQKQLAAAVHVNPKTMNAYIREKNQIPLWVAMQISKFCGEPVENLFEDDGR